MGILNYSRVAFQRTGRWCHSFLVGDSLLRVLLPGAGKPHWLCKQRRTVQPCAAEGDTRVHQSYSLRRNGEHDVPRTKPALEPRRCLPASYWRRIFGIYGIKTIHICKYAT